MSGWGGWRSRLVLLPAFAVLALDLLVVGVRLDNGGPVELAAAQPPTTVAPVPTAPTTTTTTTNPPTTTVPPTTVATTTTVAPAPQNRAPRAWTLEPYEGTGVWLDVYDWTHELTNGRPTVQPADIDRMAAQGIQTVYIQSSHYRSAAEVIEPSRFLAFVQRAHELGLGVVAWYLPTLEDVSSDLGRIAAAARLPVDGVAVDIESRAVPDTAERNRRLVELSNRLRELAGNSAIAAITPSAVHLQVINPGFWPEFPWVEIASTYDIIMPMSYWSIRVGEYRSGERYVGENIDRIRASTGRPDLRIHAIGGIADGASVADVEGMVRAIQARSVLGGSLYDWNTSNPGQWAALTPLRKD